MCLLAESSRVPWQRLVWCYERCHKAENDIRREVLREETYKVGASFVALKNATQFEKWFQRQRQRLRFVLVTDWRSAQPCMQVLEKYLGVHTLEIFVMISTSARQYARAQQRLSNVAHHIGPICIVDECNPPASLLDGIVHRAFGTATQRSAQLFSGVSPLIRAQSPQGLKLENFAINGSDTTELSDNETLDNGMKMILSAGGQLSSAPPGMHDNFLHACGRLNMPFRVKNTFINFDEKDHSANDKILARSSSSPSFDTCWSKMS